MTNHEDEHHADLARTGHEPTGAGDARSLPEGDVTDEVPDNGEGPGGDAEYLPCGPEDGPEGILSIKAWRGRLPHPDDLSGYDPDTRERIVRVFERESEAAIENDRMALEAAIRMDERESKRLDAADATDREQMKRAQWMTWSLNMMLLVAIIIAAAMGNTALVAGAVVAFGSLNVSNMYVTKGKKKQ